MTKNLAETLGANLRKLRGAMTQEAFEERTGISQARLSELERGHGWAQIRNLSERLEAAGYDPAALLQPEAPSADPMLREACDLFLRVSPTVRQGLLLILRDYATATAERTSGA